MRDRPKSADGKRPWLKLLYFFAAHQAPKPREAVVRMAPYSPPTGGRLDKLRMDFNENTIGCSPRILAFLRDHITEGLMSVYPGLQRCARGAWSFLRC